MKSRVKCRIERAGIKYLLGRCVWGRWYRDIVSCLRACVCIYIGVVCLFSGAKGLNGRRVKFYRCASFNKNAGFTECWGIKVVRGGGGGIVLDGIL